MALISTFILAPTTIGLATPAQASEWNTYSIDGLPNYVTTSTPFSVGVSGSDPICAMDFNGTRLTTAPWVFTFDPEKASDFSYSNQVDVELCDGFADYVYVRAQVPFRFSNTVVGDNSSWKTPSVSNRTEEPVTVTVTTSAGKVITSGSIAPYESFDFKLPTTKKTTTYNVTATTSGGASMTSKYTRAQGWELMVDQTPVPPCSTVTWAYDPRNEQKKAKGFKKDLVKSFKILSEETGLNFVETNNYDQAQLRYSWGNISSAGIGGTDGSVVFSRTNYWPTDKYAGFKPFKRYSVGRTTYTAGPAGRGWLIIHETMHALGFDHVDNPKSIMAPINRGQGKFTSGDLEGLHAVYLSRCPA